MEFNKSTQYNLKDTVIYELCASWYFDPNNFFIKGPTDEFILKKREVLFLEMLLKYERIITYNEMKKIIWKNKKDISANSIRLFVRDIKKKLPSNILRNFQGVGYKLTI